MVRLLELFCGTKSVGKVCDAYGIDVVSLDILPKFNPTICGNILDWDYKQYKPNDFDIIWASVPCQEYSIIKHIFGHKRDLILADSVVQRTLEIINYLKPNFWFIENPQTGLLKTRSYMKNLGFIDGDYCKYGFQYRKRTRFWTNLQGKLKMCKHNCHASKNGKHLYQITGNSRGDIGITSINDKETLYRIPFQLIESLIGQTGLINVKPKYKIKLKQIKHKIKLKL